MQDIDISNALSSAYVGGIAGHNSGSIRNCGFSGTVNSSSVQYMTFSGGIVGENYGLIEKCWNTGKITGQFYAGGIVGKNSKGIARPLLYAIAITRHHSCLFASILYWGLVPVESPAVLNPL